MSKHDSFYVKGKLHLTLNNIELQKVNIEVFKQNWDLLQLHHGPNGEEISADFKEHMVSAMGQTPDVIEELGDVCSTDQLYNNPEDKNEGCVPLEEVLTQEIKLETLKEFADDLEYRKVLKHQQRFKKYLKYKMLNQPFSQVMSAQEPASYENLVPTGEALINVRIYRVYAPTNQQNLAMSQEFQVLGCQPLCELRDKIFCPSDNMGAFERSTNTQLPPNLKTKDMYKSGFFYINNTFYNDMRHEGAEDSSDTVINWMTKNSKPSRPYNKQDMATTTFGDLEIELGQPYLYMHQGICEHLLTFCDVTILGAGDCHNKAQYPLEVAFAKPRDLKCRACTINKARWLVRESILTPEDPCVLCQTCYKSLHLDKDGNKVVDYKAYLFS